MTFEPPVLPQRFPGEALLLLRRDPIALFRSAAATYGDIVRLPLGSHPVYLINDPEIIKDVLVTRQKQFKKGRGLERAKSLLGEGLLTSEGERHLRQRRMIQPAFHRQLVAAFGEAMTHYAEQTGARWRAGEIVDMSREMMSLTLAIVGKTLFDTEIRSEADEIGGAMEDVIALFHLLMLPFAEFLEKLPLPAVLRYRRARARLDATIFRFITEHRASAESGEVRGDLLSMLLLAQDEEDGEGMTDRQVRDEAMTLFVAGHETTANALTWTWYLLSENPDVEAQFHREIDSVLAGRTPAMDDLPDLSYTRRVFSESLRLYPPAWVIGRRVLTDYSVNGYILPANSIVLPSQAVTHVDPRFFPDPLRFDPDRWTPEAEAARPKFAFFPFGGGPRVCIGEQFAWMEGILTLATLGQRWRPRLLPGHPVATEPIVTLRPKYGMKMTLERRG